MTNAHCGNSWTYSPGSERPGQHSGWYRSIALDDSCRSRALLTRRLFMRCGSLARVPRSRSPIGDRCGGSGPVQVQALSKRNSVTHSLSSLSLSLLSCLPLTKEPAQDGLLMDCAASKRTLQGVGSHQQRGSPILNPYYLVHLMYEISTAEPIKDIIYDICGTGPPIPRRSCSLSRQLKFWTDRSHSSF